MSSFATDIIIKKEGYKTEISLGKRISKLRREKKLTVQKLASELGIARSTLSGYETDAHQPDINTLKKLSDFYGVSIDYLTCQTDDPTPISSVRAVAHMENKEDLNYDALQEILYKTLKKLHEMEKKE